MQIFCRAGLGGEADAFRQFFRLLVRDRRRMEYDDTPAACLVVVELLVSLRAPVVVPKVEHHHVRRSPLLLSRPFPCVGYDNAWSLSQQREPLLLPGWIIMLAGAVVLFAGYQNDVQRIRKILLVWSVGEPAEHGFHIGTRTCGRLMQ